MSGPSFTCPVCGRTSYNEHDADEGYCGACGDWTRIRAIRETMLRHADLRKDSAAFLEGLLAALADFDPGEPALDALEALDLEGHPGPLAGLTVAQARDRLRETLAEIARRDR